MTHLLSLFGLMRVSPLAMRRKRQMDRNRRKGR